jgi:hypothetical protein
MDQSDWAGTGVEQLQQQSGAARLEDDESGVGLGVGTVKVRDAYGGEGWGGEGSEACLARATVLCVPGIS